MRIVSDMFSVNRAACPKTATRGIAAENSGRILRPHIIRLPFSSFRDQCCMLPFAYLPLIFHGIWYKPAVCVSQLRVCGLLGLPHCSSRPTMSILHFIHRFDYFRRHAPSLACTHTQSPGHPSPNPLFLCPCAAVHLLSAPVPPVLRRTPPAAHQVAVRPLPQAASRVHGLHQRRCGVRLHT